MKIYVGDGDINRMININNPGDKCKPDSCKWVKLADIKANQLESQVDVKTANIDKLPLWTEIHIQPLETTNMKESKVYWLKHPQIEPKTFYDKNFNNLVKEFIEYWENR